MGTMDEIEIDYYEKFGLPEDKVAIGVNMTEVLNYLGTREDLISKAMDDIKSFDRKKAEDEIDKFMLDSEMVALFIEYKKRKEENPNLVIPPEPTEGLFSFRNIVGAYLVYLGLKVGYNKYLE